MKHVLFSRIGIGLAAMASAICVVALAIATPIFNLLSEAFDYFAGDAMAQAVVDGANTEVAERQSQTGKGVWAFVTDLFGVEGRQYCWQAGTIA